MRNLLISFLTIVFIFALPTFTKASGLDPLVETLGSLLGNLSISETVEDSEAIANGLSEELVDVATVIDTNNVDTILTTEQQQSVDSQQLDVNIQESVETTIQTENTSVETPSTDEIVYEEIAVETDVVPEVTVINSPIVQSKSKLNSLLNIDLLGLNISLLGDKQNVDGSTSHSLLNINYNNVLENPTSSSLLNIDLGLPVVGNVNLGVLSGNVQDENNYSSGLVTLGLDNLLGETHLGVIESNKSTVGNITYYQSGLLLGDLTNTFIGDTHFGLAEVKSVETPEYKSIQTGLLLVDVTNTLIGDHHIGLLEVQQKETEGNKEISSGLVIIDSDDSPLGDHHIGIGEFGNVGSNDSTTTTSPINSNYDNNTHNVTTDSQSQPTVYLADGSEKGVITQESLQNILEYENLYEGKNATIFNLNEKLKEIANDTILNQQSDIEMEELKKVAQEVTDKANDNENVVTPTGTSSSTGTATSSSGSTGSTSTSASTAIVAYLNADFVLETEVNNQANSIVKNLSDQWKMVPLVEPPKSFFFLNNQK